MARDFMLSSKTYLDETKKKGTPTVSGDVLVKIRTLIVGRSEDDYRLERGVPSMLVGDIKKIFGLDVPKQFVSDNIQLYRKVFLFFNGTEKEKAKIKQMLSRKSHWTKFLEYLKEDGFFSWSQLQGDQKKEEEVRCAEKETPSPTITSIEEVREFLVEVAVLSGEANSVLGETLSCIPRLEAEVGTLSDLLQKEKELRLFAEKSLGAQEKILGERKRDLQTERKIRIGLEKKVEDLELLQKEYDKEIASLSQRIQFLEAELAFSPDKDVIEKIKKLVGAGADHQEEGKEQIPLFVEVGDSDPERDLPKEFKKYGLKAHYSNSFVKVFRGMDKVTQKVVVKALRELSKHGAKYPALKTVKLVAGRTLAPAGSQKSRAGMNYRFCWKSNGDQLELLELGTRESFS